MALTQAQWYEKLRKLVPSWMFEQEKITVAVFQAWAAVLAQVHQDADDAFAASFITSAVAPALEKLAEERSIVEIEDESITNYRSRIQKITSNSDKPAIKALIDSFLFTGECTILEAPGDSLYCSRGVYLSRGEYLIGFARNFFLVLIPKQAHPPYSFLSREYFASRQNFMGSLDLRDTLFTSIITAVNQVKAFGVMWELVEIG